MNSVIEKFKSKFEFDQEKWDAYKERMTDEIRFIPMGFLIFFFCYMVIQFMASIPTSSPMYHFDQSLLFALMFTVVNATVGIGAPTCKLLWKAYKRKQEQEHEGEVG